jgi:hypothetical protein
MDLLFILLQAEILGIMAATETNGNSSQGEPRTYWL